MNLKPLGWKDPSLNSGPVRDISRGAPRIKHVMQIEQNGNAAYIVKCQILVVIGYVSGLQLLRHFFSILKQPPFHCIEISWMRWTINKESGRLTSSLEQARPRTEKKQCDNPIRRGPHSLPRARQPSLEVGRSSILGIVNCKYFKAWAQDFVNP